MVPHGAANRAAISTHQHHWRSVRQYELTCATRPTPLWRQGGVPGEWSDVCGFLKPPGSENERQVRVHEAFNYPFRHSASQGNRSNLPSRSLDPPPPCFCSAGWSYFTRRHISPTKFETEELALRPQQGKEATSSVRDHAREWYMSSVWPLMASISRRSSVFINAKALPSRCSLNECESMSSHLSV